MKKPILIFISSLLLFFILAACELTVPKNITALNSFDGSYLNQYKGVEYTKVVTDNPRTLVYHVIKIKMQTSGIKFLVTPADNPGASKPLNARTTEEFAEEFGVQLAINGDAFYPWFDLSLVGYKPHSGDSVNVYGYAASDGVVYSEDSNNQPTLFFHRSGVARFEIPPTNVYHAISGVQKILAAGEVPDDLKAYSPDPRTAVGLNNGGNMLIIVIVDGRQTGFSEGVTLIELANIMKQNGARDAINLDGGGSSTLVIQNEKGDYGVVNSPIHQGIPGNQRPVANHLGVYLTVKK
jgi:hypothetical protein